MRKRQVEMLQAVADTYANDLTMITMLVPKLMMIQVEMLQF